jgi:hypothetical protein
MNSSSPYKQLCGEGNHFMMRLDMTLDPTCLPLNLLYGFGGSNRARFSDQIKDFISNPLRKK